MLKYFLAWPDQLSVVLTSSFLLGRTIFYKIPPVFISKGFHANYHDGSASLRSSAF